ncbi:glycosyl hydrolase family 95 catalytic domain-containing protein [Sphingobacterium deserti]|uniref:Alpha-L-fucosidase n=1 Tax=Sphingobacterium deserti TaxID=1229276 RepID=A0A0B8T1M9_9SPHI|nr:glycoside hydrolase family 95 protein [Sphingobacterium deserti]KGE14992.1 alpha-L-fucosidase [Sphingobacterium deserti]
MYIRVIILLQIALCFCIFSQAQQRLWYKQPAQQWEEALPIGNGYLGAMIYGAVQNEEIQFNEATLWTGEPREYNKQGAYRYLDSIRTLLDQGQQRKAEVLAQEEFMGLKSETEDPKAWLSQVSAERENPQGAASYSFDDTAWKSIQVPAYEGWEAVGLEGIDGAVWFRSSFTLTEQDLSDDWVLDLNKVREQDYTFLNGRLLGHTEGDQEKRVYRIPKEQLRVGKNVLAIQVINLSGKGGISGYKDTRQAIGVRGKKGKFISIVGQWKYWVQNSKAPKVGDYQASYQPFGSLKLRFPSANATNYSRSLDLEKGLATVSYMQNNVSFTRTYLASSPDNVLALHLAADRRGQISFSLTMDAKHQGYRVWKIDDHSLGMHVKVKDGVLEGTSFVSIKLQGGSIQEQDGWLVVDKADEASIYLTAATNFQNYKALNSSYAAQAEKDHARVQKKSFKKIRASHQQDYESLYKRFSIHLGGNAADALPTDERLKRFVETDDPALVALYIQYGRYLQIASSRKGTQPANLQGVWNHLLEPSWGSKYTTNINLEMNYWPTEMLNLSELHQPLFEMIQDLSVAGAETAKAYYGARGWVLHHNTDIWRGTAPINNANHGIWPTGGAWLVRHLWEHYLYNQDPKFIADYYDIIKGATLFFKDVLVKDPKTGWLVSSPSNSPENGGLVKGPTMDHQIVRSLFSIFVQSSQLVGKDNMLRDSIQQMLPQIAPNQIGQYGQLQEWMEDIDDPTNKHRHVSHLWGLHPGNEINAETSPDMLHAAKKSLLMRGDDGTGWSLAWKINFWARLKDAEHTYGMVKMLMRPAGKAGGSYPNLFDAHPPFQIDGNFGGAAGIGEMLLQSHSSYIDILPALPASLPEGDVRGFKARGNFEIALQWQNGKLKMLQLKSKAGKPLKLRYDGKTVELKTKKNKVYSFDAELNLL